MSESSSSSSGGIGFCGLLAIVFITLKLLGKIDWSWLWVLSPLWIPAAIVVLVLCFVGGAALAVLVAEGVSDRRRLKARKVLTLKSSPVPARETRDNNRTKESSWLH